MLLNRYINNNSVECFIYDNRTEAERAQRKFEKHNYAENRKHTYNVGHKPVYRQAGYRKEEK